MTHYFSENLVAPRIEPGPLYLLPGTLTTRPHRRSLFSKLCVVLHTLFQAKCITISYFLRYKISAIVFGFSFHRGGGGKWGMYGAFSS
jgi:hypothetical protein